MNEVEKTPSKFGWGELLVGIIFIILSFLVFNKPFKALEGLTIIIGIGFIVKGLVEFIINREMRNLSMRDYVLLLINAIMSLILGIILIFNFNFGILFISYLFAIWFVVDSIIGIATATRVQGAYNSFYYFKIIINIFGLLLGIDLLLSPVVAAVGLVSVISFYLLLIGIINISWAFNKEFRN